MVPNQDKNSEENNLLFLNVVLEGKPYKALLDSGTSHNIANPSIFNQHKINSFTTNNQVKFILADNTHKWEKDKQASIQFQINGHNFVENFNILPIFYDFILGIGFIKQNHQIITWNNGLLEPSDQVKIISSNSLKKILKSPTDVKEIFCCHLIPIFNADQEDRGIKYVEIVNNNKDLFELPNIVVDRGAFNHSIPLSTAQPVVRFTDLITQKLKN